MISNEELRRFVFDNTTTVTNSLELAIQKAADIAIPKRKISYYSKPWWNEKINKSRERLN